MKVLDKCFFDIVRSVKYFSNHSQLDISLEGETILLAVEETNNYLFQLNALFQEVGFNFYETLGQRNLSGFIGEVFSNNLSKHEVSLQVNPHADGRPDLLDLSSDEALNYYKKNCFIVIENDELLPIRARLAPFKYGGIEVKASIGSPCSSYRKILQRLKGSTNFEIGMERINYLSSITYWGHHQSCDNLLALYYDYPHEAGGSPQVLAVFHALLNSDTDWSAVSLGKQGSKKTSNTSLTATGKSKVYNGTVVTTNLQRYSRKFTELGIRVS